MTAPDVNADMRARFEAWAVRQFGPSVSLRWVAPPSGDGYYKDDPADDCWDAYRAAHADMAGEVRELVEILRDLHGYKSVEHGDVSLIDADDIWDRVGLALAKFHPTQRAGGAE